MSDASAKEEAKDVRNKHCLAMIEETGI